jgi:predicted RNA-binding protein YlxR (DUF448 family)/ribosomal protein L30E
LKPPPTLKILRQPADGWPVEGRIAMDPVQTEQRPSSADRRSAPEASRQRRCLVSRESRSREQLIRFVVSPDSAVVPDIEECLPGRGLWLTATRDIVDAACRKRVFAKAARGSVTVDDHLADIIERLLVRRCLSLLGIARRAGEAVTGFEKVRDMARGGTAGLLLTASDAAADGRRKIEATARGAHYSGGLVAGVLTSVELGGVFGRDAAVHVAVKEGALGARLLTECNRLAGFRPAIAE